MSSRFSPKSGIRLLPVSRKVWAAARAETEAGRATIAERGVMISETSRRVSSTARSSSSRVDSGRSASASSGSPPSEGISTSTLAGRGRGVGRPGDPRTTSVSTRRVAERQRGWSGPRSRPAQRPEGVEDRLGEDPADHPGQRRSPTAPIASAMAITASTAPAEARPAPSGGQRRAGRPGPGRSPRPAPRRSARSARRRARSRRPARDGRVGAELFEPAPRVGPQRPGERDRDQVQGQDRQAQAERPAQVQTDHRVVSRPASRGSSGRPARRCCVKPSPARISPSRRRIATDVGVGVVVVAAQVEQTVDHVQGQLGPGVDAGLAAPSPRPSRPRPPARPPGSGRPASESRKLITSVGQSWPRWRRLTAWIVASSTSAIEIEARLDPFAVQDPADQPRQGVGVDRQVGLGVADLHGDRPAGRGWRSSSGVGCLIVVVRWLAGGRPAVEGLGPSRRSAARDT